MTFFLKYMLEENSNKIQMECMFSYRSATYVPKFS